MRSTLPAPTRAPQKVSPLHPTLLLVIAPRNVGTSMSGNMPASTKLGERSRRSRRDSTMSLVWRPQLHLRVNVRRNYVVA
jgi:hypothetical protein